MLHIQGFEELILAKWKSFMRHVSNKHDDHPDTLFPKCAHEELEPRVWIKIGKWNEPINWVTLAFVCPTLVFYSA